MIRITRIAVVFWAMMLFALALVARSGVLQLWQGERWASRAERQHVAAAKVPAPRGDIIDASGVTLAESRQLVALAVAPREVRDRPRSFSLRFATLGASRCGIAGCAAVPRGWRSRPYAG